MTKCRKCPFVYSRRNWEAKKLWPFNLPGFIPKGGAICEGTMKPIAKEDLDKDVEECGVYQVGIRMFPVRLIKS